MPFTFSHPAILLPLINKRKKLFSATGLVTGSIAPDFESFTRISQQKIYSHTWTGMFWYDLPMAFIICVVFHSVVKNPLIENMPRSLEERFVPYKNFNWFTYLRKHVFIVLISLLIGIASHLLWDAFTHLNLRDPDSIHSTIMAGRLRLYIVLQYFCSILGLLVIARAIYWMPLHKTGKINSRKFKYWLFFILIAALISAYLITASLNEPAIDELVTSYVVIFINILISSSLISLVIVSLAYKIYFISQKDSFHGN